MLKKKIILLSACALIFSSSLLTQKQAKSQIVSPQWQYDYPLGGSPVGGIIDDQDVYHVLIQDLQDIFFTQLMAIDSTGAVISDDTIVNIDGYVPLYLDRKLNSYFLKAVTGEIYSFDEAGTQRWHVSIPYNSYKMVMDETGNSYLISSYGDGFHHHMVAMKIDSSGNLLWTAFPVTDTTSQEDFRDIACTNQGELYITGNIQHDGEDTNFYTVKINSNGTIGWSNETTYYLESIATAITVDDSGNPYITGYALGISGSAEKCVTVKFSSAGVTEWTMIDSAANMSPVDIALDGAGNVIVFGERSYTIFITKYDNSGNQLWSTDFTAVPGPQINPIKMAIDVAGNIVMLAALDVGGYDQILNYAIVKYSPGGILQWYALYDNLYDAYSQDELELASFDSHENVIVTGQSSCNDGCDFQIVNIFKFENNPLATGIGNVSSSFNLAPNPFHHAFTIELPNNEDELTLTLYNGLGIEVLTRGLTGKSMVITTGDISPGVYFVILKKDSKIIGTSKIISD